MLIKHFGDDSTTVGFIPSDTSSVSTSGGGSSGSGSTSSSMKTYLLAGVAGLGGLLFLVFGLKRKPKGA